jgi:hypothetical protein
VAGEIRDENAQLLIDELLRGESHDRFVGGKSVKQDDGADGSAGASFIDVRGHVAAASGGEHRVHFIGFSVRQEKTEDAKKDADRGVKE